MKINYHKSCSTLPIYNFYKIIDEGDMRFLIKGYSEEKNFKADKTAHNIFQQILSEYSILTSNKEILKNLKMQIFIVEMEFEKMILENILELFNKRKDFSLLPLLHEFGFDIGESKDIDALLNRVINRIKGLNNRININKINYEKRFVKNTEKIKTNLDKEALILEMNLELGREINIYTTSVSKWVNMIEVSKEKSKEVNKMLKR